MVPYRKIFEELEKKKIKYLVVGGLAVNFHRVQRLTVDLDLIIHLKRDNILATIELMTMLGYRSRLPVDPKDFADAKKRAGWIKDKGMLVFSFIHPSNPFEVVDIFVKEPRPFKDLWARRLDISIPGVKIRVIGKRDLMYLKRKAGRPKDVFDLEELKKQKD